jgi:hypothetical protein
MKLTRGERFVFEFARAPKCEKPQGRCGFLGNGMDGGKNAWRVAKCGDVGKHYFIVATLNSKASNGIFASNLGQWNFASLAIVWNSG